MTSRPIFPKRKIKIILNVKEIRDTFVDNILNNHKASILNHD